MAHKKNKPKKKYEEVKMDNLDEVMTEEMLLENDVPEGTEAEEAVDEVSVLKGEVASLNDQYLRLNAEFQNYKKRVEKEKSDLIKYGSERLFEDMLPIMDNFERAIAVSGNDETESKVLEGLNMIYKSFEAFFDKNGVKKIQAVGEPFDPQKHHAVMTESVEGFDSDVVVDVLQEGYTLNEKVIRPSMVKVSC